MFPFVAIVGQARLKKALLLSIVEPKIGGVLISGSRGSAKSTLIRSLPTLIPARNLVTLPLGASEAMVTGSLQLEQALQQGEIQFSAGLLAKAHNGLLYVDEVNLLPDHLVDLLLDVAASEINHVERDGISHQHAASFVLLGTMNPDEGELRPQLLDRFGLMATVQTDFSVAERQQIVAARLAFDRNAAGFANRWAKQTDALAKTIATAIDQLAAVKLSASIAVAIAELCADTGVEGLRADIALHRACKANAALAARKRVSAQDLQEVQELVLAHRRKVSAPQPPPQGGASSSSTSGQSGQTDSRADAATVGAWGAMAAVDIATIKTDLPPARRVRKQRQTGRVADSFATSKASGKHRGQQRSCRLPPPSQSSPHWFNTFADPANIESFRASFHAKGRYLKLHYRARQPRACELDMVLLDTSASTINGQGLGKAKGIVDSLCYQAYLARRRFSLICFGNDQVNMLMPPQRARKNPSTLLAQVNGGGGTPLTKALHFASNTIERLKSQRLSCRLYVLTDGRIPGEQLQFYGAGLLPAEVEVAIIDIESNAVRLGLGLMLAAKLNAAYFHIDAIGVAAAPQARL